MEILSWKDKEDVEIKKFPYRGKQLDVKGISIRWLSKHGDDGMGYPEYGLRFFTAQPGGEIPIHNHFYHQTMYILSGQFEKSGMRIRGFYLCAQPGAPRHEKHQ